MPDGLYKTKEDFLTKIPNKNPVLITKIGPPVSSKVSDCIESICAFYTSDDSKVTERFAIVYKGELFFREGDIKKIRRKDFIRYRTTTPNQYIKVQKYGENYLYLPITFATTSQVSPNPFGIGVIVTFDKSQCVTHTVFLGL